jgi:uncharacterized membrane protein YdbT with pleckstrin-like domain
VAAGLILSRPGEILSASVPAPHFTEAAYRLAKPLSWELPMRYVDQVLQPGESIRWVTTVSRVGYLRGIAALVAAFVVWDVTPTDSPMADLAGEIACLLLVVAALYLIGTTWWRRMMIEVAVTDRRVIYKSGLINRHTVEMNMDKIESVDVDQHLLGRLLNYGDITIHGTGDGKELIREVDHPLEFRSHVTAA